MKPIQTCLDAARKQEVWFSFKNWVFFLSIAGLVLACSELKKADVIIPPDPFDKPIPALSIVSDTFGRAELRLSQLMVNRFKPFSFATRNFQHGDFDLKNDSTLLFIPRETDSWKADSGYIVVTQSGKTKEGFLKIRNRRFPVITEVVTWPKGTPIPPMAAIWLEAFDSKELSNLAGMQEAGSQIDSIWGFVYSASISPDKLKINYLAAGGIGNFKNFGTDHIYYRIKRPNGLYYRGLIPVLIGDTTLPSAQNDELAVNPSGGFITWTTLMANDLSPGSTPPRSPSLLRLEPLAYTGNRTLKTPFGQLKDTTQGGNPAFYYQRMTTTAFIDTTFIYLEEGPEKRITRSRLIIRPN